MKQKIYNLIDNGQTETCVGYHADYRYWRGTRQRGCYAQVVKKYTGTIRIYERSYKELYTTILRQFVENLDNLEYHAKNIIDYEGLRGLKLFVQAIENKQLKKSLIIRLQRILFSILNENEYHKFFRELEKHD